MLVNSKSVHGANVSNIRASFTAEAACFLVSKEAEDTDGSKKELR